MVLSIQAVAVVVALQPQPIKQAVMAVQAW
jgi:hypothetical protein